MSPPAGLDRRRFLALLVTVAAGASVTAACGDDGDDDGSGTTTTSPVTPGPATLAEALVTLGAAVRRAEPDLEPLALDVDPSDPGRLASAVADLDEAARTDLADGNTVMVAGWVLSTTEARLCLAVA